MSLDPKEIAATAKLLGANATLVEQYLKDILPLQRQAAAYSQKIVEASSFAKDVLGRLDTTSRLAELTGKVSALAVAGIADDFHRRLVQVAIDATAWQTYLDRSRERIPPALSEMDPDAFDRVGAVAELDGIPLGWVPQLELVKELISLPDAGKRFALLDARREEICDHCMSIADGREVLWMPECAEAADTLRTGHPAAAQALAATVVDTVLRSVGAHGVLAQAAEPLDEDSPIVKEGEKIVIKPLLIAWTEWWPKSGAPIPARFSRHVTVHGMGYPGSTDKTKALIAVMLATSMARQFGRPASRSGPA